MEQKQMQYKELIDVLQLNLQFNRARVKFICLFIVSSIRNRSVNYGKNAVTLCKVNTSSNLQCFFSGFTLDFDMIASLIESIVGSTGAYHLSLDRTNWQFAGVNFNILCPNIVADGVALPLLWVMLDKKGNSDQAERIALINRFITLFGVEKIGCIIADREFIGQDWFSHLIHRQIKFYIRNKEYPIHP